MFFYIGDNPPLQSLTKVSDKLYLDKGWSNAGSIWYKGYSTECVLSEKLNDIIAGYQPAGKWCVIHNCTIYHPALRGFPLYYLNDQLSNLQLDNYASSSYKILPPSFDESLSIEEAAIIIGDILLENIQNFFKYNHNIDMNVLFSGGLDTLTSWAIFDSYTKNYVLDSYVPKKGDNELPFYNQIGRIREYESDLIDKVSKDYWGYEISSFYTKPNWYLTGYYAEVMQFRDAEAINALANYKGKWIDEIAKPNDYLYWFLKRPSLDKYKKSMLCFSNDNELKQYLYDTVFVDNQMWHFDENMTLNPFFDIRIPNVMLRLSIDDIIKNALSGIIQKKIVLRFNPKLISLLSHFKNEKSVFGNFRKNFSKITLDPNVKINIR